jgi:hypothetical protein
MGKGARDDAHHEKGVIGASTDDTDLDAILWIPLEDGC